MFAIALQTFSVTFISINRDSQYNIVIVSRLEIRHYATEWHFDPFNDGFFRQFYDVRLDFVWDSFAVFF